MPTSHTSGVRHDCAVARRRKRGEGSVFYSKRDRRWVARWSLGVIDGKRQSKRTKHRTPDAAKADLERMRRLYRAGGFPATGTLGEYLDEWLDAHAESVRPTTIASYRIHAKHHIKPLLGGIRLIELAPRDVRRLVAGMRRDGKSPGYVHLVIRTLGAALQAAVDDRIIPDNATRGVDLPRLNRTPVRALTAAEADAILDAVDGTWIERPVRVWLGSGLRRGEVIGLDQADVQAGFVRVRVSKTQIRAVPVSEDAQAALDEAIASAPRIGPDEPVFFGVRGESRHERMPASSISHALPRILSQAGLARLTPHALRHGAATLMLAGGVPMRVIAEQLGHRNPALTARIYAHVIPEAQRTAVGHLPRRQAR